MQCVSKEEQPVMESRQSCHTIGAWRKITHLLQSCYSQSHAYTSSMHYHQCSKYIINPSSSAIYIPSTSYTRAQSGIQRKKNLLQSGICLGRLRPLRGESADATFNPKEILPPSVRCQGASLTSRPSGDKTISALNVSISSTIIMEAELWNSL